MLSPVAERDQAEAYFVRRLPSLIVRFKNRLVSKGLSEEQALWLCGEVVKTSRVVAIVGRTGAEQDVR